MSYGPLRFRLAKIEPYLTPSRLPTLSQSCLYGSSTLPYRIYVRSQHETRGALLLLSSRPYPISCVSSFPFPFFLFFFLLLPFRVRPLNDEPCLLFWSGPPPPPLHPSFILSFSRMEEEEEEEALSDGEIFKAAIKLPLMILYIV